MKYYSQFGEDKYLSENIKLPKNGVFIDIGAGNGLWGSNSKYFENLGWDGLCIEPNPIDYEKCLKIRNKVLNVAVSNKEGEVKFYLHKNTPSLSGLKIHNDSYKEIKVNALRLDSILKRENLKQVDILSIDTEGTEVDILNSFDICEVKPKIIIVEFITRGVKNDDLIKFFDNLSELYELKKVLGANHIYTLKGGFEEKKYPRHLFPTVKLASIEANG